MCLLFFGVFFRLFSGLCAPLIWQVRSVPMQICFSFCFVDCAECTFRHVWLACYAMSLLSGFASCYVQSVCFLFLFCFCFVFCFIIFWISKVHSVLELFVDHPLFALIEPFRNLPFP